MATSTQPVINVVQHLSTKIICRTGPEWTPAGQNETIIQHKAAVFTKIFKKYPDLGSSCDLSVLQKDDFTPDEVWKDCMESFVRYRLILQQLSKAGYNPLFCTEDDVRNFLKSYVFGTNDVKEKAGQDTEEGAKSNKLIIKDTLAKRCSVLRGALRSIGREHEWGYGKEYRIYGEKLLFSGNPMSQSVEKAMKMDLKAEIKKRKGQLVVSGSDKDGVSKKKGDVSKHASPVSVVVLFANIMMSLHKATDLFVRWRKGEIKQTARIANQCALVLIKSFLMHEGCRPGEIQNHLMHTDLTLPLHENVYWLTLVFLDPDTLAYLMKRPNALVTYVINFWKGKKKQAHLRRRKAILPLAYNTLDVLWQYIVTMKVVFTVEPGRLRFSPAKGGSVEPIPAGWRMINGDASSKGTQNFSDLNVKLNKVMGITDFSFYSVRYAATEEDKANNIPWKWTELRMGHSAKSKMQEAYAANNKRVLVDDTPILLGTDVHLPINHKHLEFDVVSAGVLLKKNWLADTFGASDKSMEMITDFETTARLVKAMLEDNDVAARETLLGKLSAGTSAEIPFGHIPMGVQIALNDKLMPESLKAPYEDAIEGLSKLFDRVEDVANTVELTYFAQTLYGKWQNEGRDNLVHARAETMRETVTQPQVAQHREVTPSTTNTDVNDATLAMSLHDQLQGGIMQEMGASEVAVEAVKEMIEQDEDRGVCEDDSGDENEINPPALHVAPDGAGIFAVEKLVRHRKKAERMEFLVRWVGYSSRDDTWEPESSITAAALEEYWQGVEDKKAERKAAKEARGREKKREDIEKPMENIDAPEHAEASGEPTSNKRRRLPSMKARESAAE